MFLFSGLPFLTYESKSGGFKFTNACLFKYVGARGEVKYSEGPINDNRPKSAIEIHSSARALPSQK